MTEVRSIIQPCTYLRLDDIDIPIDDPIILDDEILDRLKCVFPGGNPEPWDTLKDLQNCTKESFDKGECPQELP